MGAGCRKMCVCQGRGCAPCFYIARTINSPSFEVSTSYAAIIKIFIFCVTLDLSLIHLVCSYLRIFDVCMYVCGWLGHDACDGYESSGRPRPAVLNKKEWMPVSVRARALARSWESSGRPVRQEKFSDPGRRYLPKKTPLDGVGMCGAT